VKPLDHILATAGAAPLRRSLGAVQLTLLGVGAVIGTGIFVLTAEAAQKAGPGMMVSFIIAGSVCAVAALCYAELAAMVPVAGSAYTYAYAVLGEAVAWLVGWALLMEYALGASAVAVGWSGYVAGLLSHFAGVTIPPALAAGPYGDGVFNLPAVVIVALATGLLIVGTRESARVNAVLVAVKVVALTCFVVLTAPLIRGHNFAPFTPRGWGDPFGAGGTGVLGAAASIFFAYVGFDAVSTAAEETRDPQRNVPIGLVGALAICTVFYLLVAAGAIGAVGAQPVAGAHGGAIAAGSIELAQRCAQIAGPAPLVCSREALAQVLRQVGHPLAGDFVGLAAGFALPSVVLVVIFGQTRISFAMARDGLLPERLARVHPRFKTPHLLTLITGAAVALAAAFLPVGKLADYSNSGTLFAFAVVSAAVMVLRLTDRNRHRPFRAPLVFIVAPLAIAGCVVLFISLPLGAKLLFPAWSFLGLALYAAYGYRHSRLARGGVKGELRF
jgi:APA family basic amino acid/polyamine antiporter